jgi:hypothetical protein
MPQSQCHILIATCSYVAKRGRTWLQRKQTCNNVTKTRQTVTKRDLTILFLDMFKIQLRFPATYYNVLCSVARTWQNMAERSTTWLQRKKHDRTRTKRNRLVPVILSRFGPPRCVPFLTPTFCKNVPTFCKLRLLATLSYVLGTLSPRCSPAVIRLTCDIVRSIT